MKEENADITAATTQYWSASCSTRRREGGDAIRNIEMSWDAVSTAQIMENLNTFLTATGLPLKVVRGR